MKLVYIIGIIALLAAGCLYFQNQPEGTGMPYISCIPIGTSISSTSPEYLVNDTASSTSSVLNVSGIDQVRVMWRFNASNTNAILKWTPEFSHTSSNDWYQDTLRITPAVKSSLTHKGYTMHSSSTPFESWSVATTTATGATTTKSALISDINAKYMRLKYGVKAADGAIWGYMCKEVK